MTNQQTYPPSDPSSAGQPERVTSDPVPVPPPPGDARDRVEPDPDRDRVEADADRVAPGGQPAEDVTDRVPEEALDDQGTFEDPALAGERADPDDLTSVKPANDGVEPEFHEPPPQRTAFGAATVGGAVAASAQAGPSRPIDETDTPEGEPPGPVATDSATPDAAPPDAAAPDTTAPDTTAPDSAVSASAADEPVAEEPVADESVVEEPVAGGPVVDEPVTGLWGEEAVQGFRDRWRDIQLRFIDDPASATQEAGRLVDEAVESLTAALNSQRAALESPSTTDTEQLRVAVRQHRDFLDRLLGL